MALTAITADGRLLTCALPSKTRTEPKARIRLSSSFSYAPLFYFSILFTFFFFFFLAIVTEKQPTSKIVKMLLLRAANHFIPELKCYTITSRLFFSYIINISGKFFYNKNPHYKGNFMIRYLKFASFKFMLV